ncbi:MAG: hypothetical protein IKO35_00875 [Elusimicrobiaceae bacterium]|nr:hypothetical protein [Elusimicrobiaceae bacterium]
MKKSLLAFVFGILFLLSAPALYAQDIVGEANKVKAALSSEQALANAAAANKLSGQLRQRAIQTFNQTKQMSRKMKGYLAFPEYLHPALRKGKTTELFAPTDPYRLYPYAPDGLRWSNVPLYMATKNNLEIRQLLQQAKDRLQVLAAMSSAGVLDGAFLEDVPPVGEEIPWLIEQIPADTQYLLLGEEHYYESIKSSVANTLALLRQQMPQREIILFTEFLPNTYTTSRGIKIPKNTDPSIKEFEKLHSEFTTSDGITYMTKVVFQAEELEIPIVGLEPTYVGYTDGKFNARLYDLETETSFRESLWATPEGIRLRNRDWLRTIQNYRRRHPKALFVVYAGAGHLGYDMPYSVGEALVEKGKTFMVEFVKTKRRHDGNVFLPDGQHVLHCATKDLARLMGFDVRIVIGK